MISSEDTTALLHGGMTKGLSTEAGSGVANGYPDSLKHKRLLMLLPHGDNGAERLLIVPHQTSRTAS